VHLSEIQIRDPFVVTVPGERAYYLFGSTDPDIWSGPGLGFDCYRSLDLSEWDGPVAAFRPPSDFWSPGCYWAPEVHRFGDDWFMLATFAGADGHRGTQVLRAAHPQGPYEPWSDGAVTPAEWQCLDGTLHVDETGAWLVFCHEWVQCGDGEICAVRLADDVRSTIGDVTLLFRASEATWTSDTLVTDGPFLHRTADGALLMLWSSMGARGYAMGLARSATGSVLGPWRQDDAPLWSEDGGHGMVFRALDGQLYLTLHTPNESPRERALFVPLVETGGDLRLVPRRADQSG
jgi:arabinan endo-1,5-alpha-L-arabinosidase